MGHIGGVARTGATVMLVAAVVAACGSDDDGDGAPSGQQGVSTEQLRSRRDAVAEVGTLIDEAGNGAEDYQALVRRVHDQDPGAVTTDPRVTAALAEQQERQQARDEAIAALGDQPAVAEPDVAAAYDDFAAAATRMFTFQDGYNASMPAFLHAQDVCTKIFDVDVDMDALTLILGGFEEQWRKAHEKRARPCEAALRPLADSDNVNMRRVVDITERVIRERTAAMTDVGVTRAQMDRATARLKRANDTFLERYGEVTAFSDELGRISAVDEYHALEGVLDDELGGGASSSPSSGSPSGSPSESPSG